MKVFDPDAVLVVKVFASPDATEPAAEVVADFYPDRVTTQTTGDPDVVSLAAEALQVATGQHPTQRDGTAMAAGVGGVVLGALLGGE